MRTSTQVKTPSSDPRVVPTLARTIFKQMRDQGYSKEQIIGLSSALLDLVSADLKEDLGPAE